jgi:hypothetical protein
MFSPKFFILSIILLNIYVLAKITIPEKYGPLNENEKKEIDTEMKKLSYFLELKQKENISSSSEGNFLEPITNKNHTDSFICKSCLKTFGTIHDFLAKKYGISVFNEVITVFCSIFLKSEICSAAINLYSPLILDSLLERYFNAEFLCTNKLVCKYSHFQYLNPDDYANYLFKDKPARINIEPNKNAPKLKILQVTDMHVDAEYLEVKY